MIELVKQNIEESLKSKKNGKELHQQSIENYVTEILDLELISVEKLEDKHAYKDRFKLVAKSKKEGIDSEFTFISDHYNVEWFVARENSLMLVEIKGEAGVHEVEKTFYFGQTHDEINKNDKILTTPLDEIISGVNSDPDIDFVVDYLKEVFEGKFDYKYEEKNKGDKGTFEIKLGEKIVISRGFSNAVQVNFRNGYFRSVSIIFRDIEQNDLKNKIDKMYLIIEAYFNDNIVFQSHNISELNNFLQERDLRAEIDLGILLREKVVNPTVFHNFVIEAEDDFNSYRQVDIVIGHNTSTGNLEILMNYLFKRTLIVCPTVDDVKAAIEEIQSLIVE